MNRLFLAATLLGGCAASTPPGALVVVTFDADGAISNVSSRDLAADDPARATCATLVGELRASIRGPSAGAGEVTFRCPIASLTSGGARTP